MTELELMKNFGNNLKEILEDSWMTQKELSEETGLSESMISYYIHGKRMPNMKNIINIALALDCELNELIEIKERIM